MAAGFPMLMGSKREKEDRVNAPDARSVVQWICSIELVSRCLSSRIGTSRQSAQNPIDRGNKNTIVMDGLASAEESRLARTPDGVSPVSSRRKGGSGGQVGKSCRPFTASSSKQGRPARPCRGPPLKRIVSLKIKLIYY
jgi:hypothetical protein